MLSAPSHRKDELAEEVPALLCGRAALSTSKAPAEAYPAQSKTFLRQGPAHGFPQNLKSQFVGRSLASVLLKKKKKKKGPVMGSPRAEPVLWELLLHWAVLNSFHGNTEKQHTADTQPHMRATAFQGGSGLMSTETIMKLGTSFQSTAPCGRVEGSPMCSP